MNIHPYLFIYITSEHHWIGLVTDFPCDDCYYGAGAECEFCRSRWYWLDGSTYDFQLWDYNDPNYFDSCATVSTGDFVDRNCRIAYKYICKFPL